MQSTSHDQGIVKRLLPAIATGMLLLAGFAEQGGAVAAEARAAAQALPLPPGSGMSTANGGREVGPSVANLPPSLARSGAVAVPGALEISLPSMIRSTDPLVRGVLILLLLASVLTWTVWGAKTIELGRARRRLKADLVLLEDADSLAEVQGLASEAARAMLKAVRTELSRAGDLRKAVSAEGLRERVTMRLLSVEAALARDMSAGVNTVASIGATAPFVGLFGTVWGIMSSFIGIARLQISNLMAVAPGIAEALLTTAAGLAAAVPAVLIYNGFARSVSGYQALLADASHATACVLSLDIERLQLGDSDEEPKLAKGAVHGV